MQMKNCENAKKKRKEKKHNVLKSQIIKSDLTSQIRDYISNKKN